MTPSAPASKAPVPSPVTHRGPLEWRLLLNWLAEDGILTPQDVDTVMQRFAAGTSAQPPMASSTGAANLLTAEPELPAP